MRVSLVIPCFREAGALPALVDALQETRFFYEIVFVDDGSDDATPARLAEAAGRDPRVRVVTHARNRGVGAAMRTGMACATGDIVVVYDADMSYPLARAEALVQALDEAHAHVASASPFLAGGGVQAVPLLRRVFTKGAHRAWRLVTGRSARDLSVFTCAFRAYRREAIAALPRTSDGFAAAAEILAALLVSGHVVVERPAPLRARQAGASKMRILPTLMGHAGGLLRTAWRRFE